MRLEAEGEEGGDMVVLGGSQETRWRVRGRENRDKKERGNEGRKVNSGG